MTNKDGIIKFELRYTPGDALPEEELINIGNIRSLLRALGLIGQDPARYGGYGFGNISHRIPPFPAKKHHRRFVITGTQTGHLDVLGPEHYAIVNVCVPSQNLIEATGPIKPSSESLTHGAVYDLSAWTRCVIHVHSPKMWNAAERLNLPTTDPDVPYGSPELAAEVERLHAESDLRKRRVFAMGGHEDGVIAYGRTLNSAINALLKVHRQARR